MTELTLLIVDQDGTVVRQEGDLDAVRPIASVGKLLLLSYVGAELDAGRIDGHELLSRLSVAAVADSGLWQHLDVDSLSVLDCCRLVAAVSDNLATNVLLERVGVGAVGSFSQSLDLAPYELLDLIRDERGPHTAPTFARGSARSIVRFLQLLARGVVSPRVREWMALNVDLTLAADVFALDPLAHVDDEPRLINKTGSDDGVRVDVGTVTDRGRALHYCAMVHWDAAEPFTHSLAQQIRAPFVDPRVF